MAVILVTDDDERNRELMEAYLRRSRHRVLVAGSAREALARAVAEPPDLAVVDSDMPGVGGLQVMRELKQRSPGEYLPVILVVPFGDQETRLGAWQAGADEVMARPVHREELLARMESLLALRAERQVMARTNRELLRLQEFKASFDQLLVHDLKNPLAALSANLEYLGQEVPADGRGDLVEAVQDALGASRRLQRMVASILDVTAFEEGALTPNRAPLALPSLLSGLQRLHRHAAEERGVTLEVDCAPALELLVDRELFTRVVENLIETALRRTTRGGRVGARARQEGGVVRLVVDSTGNPIPETMRPHLFEKYGALDTPEGQQRVGVGLGLYFCRLAVEAHGGRIALGPQPGEAAAPPEGAPAAPPARLAFVIELPAHPGKR